MTRVMAKGYNDTIDKEARYEMKKDLAKARKEEAIKGEASYTQQSLPDPKALPANTPEFVADYARYYKDRGYHARSVNSNGEGKTGWLKSNTPAFISMPILSYAGELKAPALIVAGELAHSRYFSQDAYNALGSEQKRLLIVPKAKHTDLYDNVKLIPFDEFASFFKQNLN